MVGQSAPSAVQRHEGVLDDVLGCFLIAHQQERQPDQTQLSHLLRSWSSRSSGSSGGIAPRPRKDGSSSWRPSGR